MTKRALPFLIVVVLGFSGLAGYLNSSARDPFPHELHEGLFPTCDACHAGIPDQNRAAFFSVTAENCAGCHDGESMDPVDWEPPPPAATNLMFDHNLHVEGVEVECETCHQIDGSDNRMAVQRPAPEVCLDCHDASAHLAPEADCAMCHMPLTEATALSTSRIAAFPQPESHTDPGFIFAHGDLAGTSPDQCATCHAQDLCATCHLNAGEVGAIQALGADARVAELSANRQGAWPAPESHADPDWALVHSDAARSSIQTCANCHSQSSCRECHGDEPPQIVLSLPAAAPEGPQGVELSDVELPGHVPGFALRHQTAAAVGTPNCTSCHSPTYCVECHNAASKPGFHPANYALRHGADAFARNTDCASCHTSEVFCRTCHEDVGLSAQNPVNSSYHDAEPFWLLSHGRAARQGMESCTTCHQQTDCLECHSAKSGWRVSPHGPGFDADALGDRSLFMCAQCHSSDPRN